PAAAGLVEASKTVLRDHIALSGGEPIEARSLAIVLRQASTTVLVEGPEIGLRGRVPLVGGEPIVTRGFRQSLGAPVLLQCSRELKCQPSIIRPGLQRDPASLNRRRGIDLLKSHALNT